MTLPLMEGGRCSLGIEGIEDIEFEALLGIGGFGQMWRVRDVGSGRHYAMKVFQNLKPGSVEKDRIVLEAGVVIGSPFVVPVVGFREWDERTFLILFKYVDAEDLESRLLKGDLTPKEKKRVFLEVLHGVATAHSRNIIHRDLKPANILVGRDGHARVIDFGIAKFKDKAITRTGDRFGTPEYLPPEVLIRDSKTVDASADIYALGQILYELSMGRHFWDVKGWRVVEDMLDFCINTEPESIMDLEGFHCDFFEGAGAIIEKMTRFEPEDRYGSIKEILSILGPLETEREEERPEPGGDRSSIRLDEFPVLVVESGTNKGAISVLSLDEGRSRVLGRGDLAGDHASLSRKHIEVQRKGDRFLVRDAGSKNGTMLRGNALGEEFRSVQSDDRIMLGDLYLRFTYLSDEKGGET